MERRRRPKKIPQRPAIRRTAPAAEIERLLDALEEKAIAGEGEPEAVLSDVQALTEQQRVVPDVLVRRLIEGRARIPEFSFTLLLATAGAQAQRRLRQIAEAQQAPDATRLEAQRLLGWPERGEAKRRVAFLESLRDADLALIEAAAAGGGRWPWQSEVLGDVVAYLMALPADRRLALTRRLAGVDAAAPLLLALMHVEDPEVQRLAIEVIGGRGRAAAPGAIGRLAATTRNLRVRADAERFARQLSASPPDVEPGALPLPPVDQVLISAVDGSGAQLALIQRRLDTSFNVLMHIFTDDRSGLRDVYGVIGVPPDYVTDILISFSGQGVEFFETDLAAVRGLVGAAIEVNSAEGHPIPPIFELWEPLLHDLYPPEKAEPVIVPELEEPPGPPRGSPGKVARRLLDHDFFESWMADPETVREVLPDLPPLPASGRPGERQYRALIEEWLDDPTRDRLRARLRRQAWLLDEAGEPALRDAALATAAAVAAGDVRDLAKHPFPRGLIDRAIAQILVPPLLGPGIIDLSDMLL